MHQAILDGVVFRNYSLRMNRKPKLNAIKSAFDLLMSGFHSKTVVVDYSINDIQDAYLVRYFPIHTKLIGDVLNDIQSNGVVPFEKGANLQVSLIGCGPCPEVVGIMDYLANHHRDIQPVFHAFDLLDSAWQNNRKDSLASTISGKRPKVSGHKFDLCQVNAVNQHASTFAYSQLVVLQNCLNELAITSFNTVFENLKQILDLMPIGSRFIAIDIINYPMIFKVLSNLQTHAIYSKNLEIELGYSPNSVDDINSDDDYPSELRESRITKKPQVRYVRLVIRKIA